MLTANAMHARVVRFDLSTGKGEPWRELAPADTEKLPLLSGRKVAQAFVRLGWQVAPPEARMIA